MPEHPTIPPCPLCGEDVPRPPTGRPHRLYCSMRCSVTAANTARAATRAGKRASATIRCLTCGTERVLYHQQARRLQKYCSRACADTARVGRPGPKGPNAPGWKGGRWVTTKGYVRIYAPEYPNAKKDGFIFEHRMVMERMLGRALRPGEEVHHLNGDRADNRPENLELWFVRRQPKGIRLGDVPHCATCTC